MKIKYVTLVKCIFMITIIFAAPSGVMGTIYAALRRLIVVCVPPFVYH